ncbi:MAG TPA: M50 family metallopeptidase [Candidatus Rubrimentiphilum sp.]|nr:M50 family metallopeptidase [Candidatus Rubrimentiphilum sp.]
MTTFLSLVTLTSVGKVALFLIVLSVLVVLHEYGHFILARLSKVRVLEFSVGFGPRLAGWTSRASGTMYSLRALPLGGYCAMYGEDNKASEAEQQREFRDQPRVYEDDNFQAKNAWTRLAIIAAGPIANFILCFIILFVSALAFGVQSDRLQPRIGPVSRGMPAQRAGLQAGDQILQVNGVTIASGEQLVKLVHSSLNKPLRVTFNHNGAVRTVTVTPAHCPAPENRSWGCFGFVPVAMFERVSFGRAISGAVTNFAYIGGEVFGSLALLVRHPVQYGSQLQGVVGMGQAAMTIEDFGWGPYFFFAALISFALGLFNLLPLPALDGGRAAFIVAELVRGKPVDPEKEALVHITGFAVLIALILVINFYNAVQIYQGKGPF